MNVETKSLLLGIAIGAIGAMFAISMIIDNTQIKQTNEALAQQTALNHKLQKEKATCVKRLSTYEADLRYVMILGASPDVALKILRASYAQDVDPK